MNSREEPQPGPAAPPQPTGAPYTLVAASVVVLSALLYTFGDCGAAQDQHNQRILFEIDQTMRQAVGWTRQLRIDIYRNLDQLVAGFSIWCAVLFGAGLLTAGGSILPTGAGLSALCFGFWGQSLIFHGQAATGWAVLGLAFCLAFVSGALRPIDRTAGFPDAWATGPVGAPARRTEIAALFILLVVTVVVRTYALTELRSPFDGESIHEMNMSRTVFGLRHYLDYSFIANASGLIQLLPQSLSFQLFGTSIFSQRFSAVMVGSFVVLLAYYFVRRIAGVWPALMTAALLCLAPEQLFWSRSEVTQFASVLLVALIVVQLSFAMARNLSFLLTLATALAMPLCRLVYTPGWALVALPWLLTGHSLVFGRARRLKALYVIPMLVLGTALWAYSPSLLRWTFLDSGAHFVSPTEVYGHSFVRRSGELRTLDTEDLLRAQVRGVATRSVMVAQHFFDDCNLITHWYNRTHVSQRHRTIANSALAVWAFCGLFYLLARLKDPRAFGMLALTGLAIVPTVMSPDPFPRRMLVVFLVLPISAAIFAAALVRGARRAGAVTVSHLLAATAALATILLALVQGSSYLEMRTAPGPLLEAHRFTRQVFAESDAIFHNLPYRARGNLAQMIAFGSLDDIVEKGTAFEPVENGAWIDAALNPTAHYSNPVDDVIFSKTERELLKRRNPMRRITFLLEKSPKSSRAIAAIKAIYPGASSSEGAGLLAIRTDRGRLDERLNPELLLGRGRPLPSSAVKLNGRTLRTRRTDAAVSSVAAGVFVKDDSWTAWAMRPACPSATLRIDGVAVAWSETRPLLTGIHDLRLTLPEHCPPPIEITQRTGEQPPVRADLVAPELAREPALQAKPARVYAGYSDARALGKLPHQVADLAIDGDHLSVLGWNGNKAIVTRLDLDGNELGHWDAGSEFPYSIAVDSDGTHAILTHQKIKLYSRQGELLHEAKSPGVESNSTATFWQASSSPGASHPQLHPRPQPGAAGVLAHQLLVSSRQDSTLDIVDRTGRTVRRINGLYGNQGRFGRLRSVASDGVALVVVTDESNRAFVIHAEGDQFAPLRASMFAIDEARRGTAVDDRGRILIPSQRGFQIYLEDGTRLIADSPARDLESGRFGAYPIAAVRGRDIYILDKSRRTLTRVTW